MPLYFAPMEGVTDATFRRVHRECFGGVDKYFLPFVSPTESGVFTPKERREIDPASNEGTYAVPQILTKHARHFLWAARQLKQLGYSEVNLNLGCPSGTVTGKGKGSGFLLYPQALEAFLDEIFGHSPLPVSIKTRIGYLSPEEWPALLELFARYPIHELIIHPRTRKQFYKGSVHEEAYTLAFQRLRVPLIANGDLFSPAACAAAQSRHPGFGALMLGRGIVANPALAQEIKGDTPLTLPALRHFYERLVSAYEETGNDMLALARLRAITYYMAPLFQDAHKPWKQMRKARTLWEFLDTSRLLFTGHELTDKPYYELWDL